MAGNSNHKLGDRARLRARGPGCQKLNIPPAASVATEPPSCARYARIALTKPLRRPRPQGQPSCFAHMTTVSARAQSTCSVMAAFAEPGASRRRSASRGALPGPGDGHEAPAARGLRRVAAVARCAVPPRVAPPVRKSIGRAAQPARHQRHGAPRAEALERRPEQRLLPGAAPPRVQRPRCFFGSALAAE